MGRKKTQAGPVAPRPNAGWEYITEMQINGRNVTKGTELKISGERGRFVFVNYTKTDNGKEWLTVWGGPKGMESTRSFYLDKVKTVHSKNKTDGNLVKALKERKKAEKQANQDEQ
jgi:Na+-transporting NADH:ubiquinone oxidoreductase subunit NqrF